MCGVESACASRVARARKTASPSSARRTGRRKDRQADASTIRRPHGLCSTCERAAACTHVVYQGRAVLHCEEHEGLTVRTMKATAKPAATAGTLLASPRTSLNKRTGLCGHCVQLKTCTFPKPEGGVWHCTDYA